MTRQTQVGEAIRRLTAEFGTVLRDESELGRMIAADVRRLINEVVDLRMENEILMGVIGDEGERRGISRPIGRPGELVSSVRALIGRLARVNANAAVRVGDSYNGVHQIVDIIEEDEIIFLSINSGLRQYLERRGDLLQHMARGQ